MTILPNSVDGARLKQQLNNNRDSVPMTWLGVFQDPSNPAGMGEVKVVHGLAVYGTPIGTVANPAVHDRLYCLVDDLLPGNQVPHFILPEAALDVTGDIRVPTLDTLNANLNPLPTHFGPYNNNGADSEYIQTRSLCWVPPFIASQVINSGDRSPHTIAALVGSAVASIGWRHLESNLLVWLRAMLTVDPIGQSMVAIPPFKQASLDEGLVNFRWGIVSSDLPTLGNAVIHSGAQQISAAIGSGVAAFVDYRQEESERRLAAEAAKKGTVRKKYEHCMVELLRLLQVEAPEDAPDVWHKLASGSSKTTRATVQASISRTCQSLGLPSMTVSPGLAATLVSPPDYATDELDGDLHQGWTVWRSLAKTGLGRKEDRSVSQAYDLAQSMGTALSYADASQFLTADTTVSVATPAHAIATLKANYAISHTLLGASHTVTTSFMRLIRWLDNNQLLLQQKWETFTPDPLAFPTAMLFYFHKDLSTWINYQLVSDRSIPGPDFLEWSYKLSKRDQWFRGLPSSMEYGDLIGGGKQEIGVVSDDGRTMVSGLTETSSSTGSNLTDSKDGSDKGGKDKDGRGDRGKPMTQDPADQVAALLAFKNPPRQLRVALKAAADAGDPLPADDYNVPFCLSYHTKGSCYDNCNRHAKASKSNHRKLGKAEVDRLVTWCKKHLS